MSSDESDAANSASEQESDDVEHEREIKKEVDDEDSNDEDMDLNASDTESDDDVEQYHEIKVEQDDEDSNDEDDTNDNKAGIITRAERIKQKILDKYNSLQGKQLYVRFPQRLPADEQEFIAKVRTISELIVKVNKPRQRSCFCTVDFASQSDRDIALKRIKKSIETDVTKKGIVVCPPRTENNEYVNGLVERKLTSIENKRAKLRLRKASKQAVREKNFTSSIVVLNLPQNSTASDVRNLFPNAVDVQIKPRKAKGIGLAVITLPSTMDARVAVKQDVSLNGIKLKIKFDAGKFKKNVQKQKEKNQKVKKEAKTKNRNSNNFKVKTEPSA